LCLSMHFWHMDLSPYFKWHWQSQIDFISDSKL
jgi:hypothetical protein